MERTEEQKLTLAPTIVILGGEEHEIRPLVIRYSGEWRKKSIPLINYLMSYGRIASDTSSPEFAEAVTELFTTKTDEILDSFFEYARDLNRAEIENVATDGEVINAFVEVFNAFVAPLSAAAAQKVETSQSEESSSSS